VLEAQRYSIQPHSTKTAGFFLRTAASLVVILSVAPELLAQSAILRGQITDESGAAVPRATVIVTGPGGSSKVAAADDKGSYSIAGLPAGDYQVTATAPQLSTSQPSRVSLGQNAVTLNLTVKVVSTTQRVTVRGKPDPRSASIPRTTPADWCCVEPICWRSPTIRTI
jgi:hypothetical protein